MNDHLVGTTDEGKKVRILFASNDPDTAAVLDVFETDEEVKVATPEMLRLVHPAGAALYETVVKDGEGCLPTLVEIL